jgi:predicted transcriptional regulator
MWFTKNILSRIYSLLTIDGERLFYLALAAEEPDRDGFFFFHCEDWEERYSVPISTIRRYLKHLEDKGLIIKEIRSLSEDTPYPIKKGGTYLFIKVLQPETEKDMTFFGTLHLIKTQVFSWDKTFKMAIFKDVYNVTDTINCSHVFCHLEEHDANSRALENIKNGQKVFFKGQVIRNKENQPLIINIRNIRPIEEFYTNGRH